ncbi:MULTISPECIES: hypothetical protein [unclassified Bradyrhizobium]|uniref:hypothetical protein n=1 Tax=unclassified Bradyrhizobium TaxID=2631580 RepID=UPI003392DA18
MEQFGGDTLTTFQKAGADTVRILQKAGGDTFATIQKAGHDSIRTTYKAAGDAIATYVKAWHDTGEQAQRSFNDATDAGQAVSHYVENQAKAEIDAVKSAQKRLREGKVVDSWWGLATEPLKSSEENFAKATQESEVINTAAGSAAAVYGGPAGAAAYAAWSTYRRTGNADMALRAGVLAAVTSQMGSSVAQMPAGTAGEIVKKAAMAGAAGGISVAAAGGDEQAIKDGFFKSAGAVLIQGASDKLEAYSPKAKDAYDTVHCISARDVDCLSNTTWARDAKGKILYDKDGNPRFDTSKFDPRDYACIAARDVDCLSNTTWARDAQGKILYDKDGNPRFDTSKLDPTQYTGKWTKLDPQSAEGKTNAFITQTSKLPKTEALPEMEAIPILKNQWVLTWTLGKQEDIAYKKPTVVLTYVGKDVPFTSTVEYGGKAKTPRKISQFRVPYGYFVGYLCPPGCAYGCLYRELWAVLRAYPVRNQCVRPQRPLAASRRAAELR